MESTVLDHPLVFLRNLTYWGIIMIISAGMLYSLNASHIARHKPAITRAVAIAKAPVVFPALALQGLIFDGAKSSALINGHVVGIGEGIGNVKVVAINQDHVEVELEGQTKMLFLEE